MVKKIYAFIKKYEWALALAFFACLFFSEIFALIIAGVIGIEVLYPYALIVYHWLDHLV